MCEKVGSPTPINVVPIGFVLYATGMFSIIDSFFDVDRHWIKTKNVTIVCNIFEFFATFFQFLCLFFKSWNTFAKAGRFLQIL